LDVDFEIFFVVWKYLRILSVGISDVIVNIRG
jgi:hypothetical protein